jgi:hypothetical protein
MILSNHRFILLLMNPLLVTQPHRSRWNSSLERSSTTVPPVHIDLSLLVPQSCALLEVLDTVDSGIDYKKMILLVLHDLGVDFDTIDHDIQ